MKKSFKAVISVIVALTLVFGTASVAFADHGCTCDKTPVIFVNGIGGMIYATLMTLFVVPVMYDIFNRKEMKVVKDEDLTAVEE